MPAGQLLDAVRTRSIQAVRSALSTGADVNIGDDGGLTALMEAVILGLDDVVTLLLHSGANVNAGDERGWTALHFAAQEWHAPIARMLLEAGASVDAIDQDGNTPLWRAVFNSKGRGDLIALLLAAGANKTKPNKAGTSPETLAARISNYPVAQFLSSPAQA